jgi:hypothetical protein
MNMYSSEKRKLIAQHAQLVSQLASTSDPSSLSSEEIRAELKEIESQLSMTPTEIRSAAVAIYEEQYG